MASSPKPQVFRPGHQLHLRGLGSFMRLLGSDFLIYEAAICRSNPGARGTADDGRSVEYRGAAEMARAIAELERELSALQARRAADPGLHLEGALSIEPGLAPCRGGAAPGATLSVTIDYETDAPLA